MCWATRQYPFGEARLVDVGEIIAFITKLSKYEIVTVSVSSALTD
jgi:hypothetical protein